MHGPKSTNLPEQHRFRTSATVVSRNRTAWFLFFKRICQASLENKLLTEIYDSVKSHYLDGTPLHHLPSASNPDLNDAADRPNRSSIFVISYPDFVAMPPLKLQQIFRHRHILVSDVPNPPEEFSERNIAALGAYERVRNVQGMFDCVFEIGRHSLAR
jgi:hypothetical protein